MSAFDHLAPEYDQTFSDTEIGRRQRALVHDYLESFWSSEKQWNILELNAGTGVDALHLLAKGAKVTVTDVSEGMVNEASQKIAASPYADRARLKTLHAGLPLDTEDSYQMVFSNFGGLNCLSPDELDQWGENLKVWLPPGGHFVGVIMPRFCGWETMYFLAKLRGKSAFRRSSKSAVQVDLGESELPIWYYNPNDFARILGEDFELVHQQPVGFFLPPSYLEPRFSKRPKSLKRLTRWEGRATHWRRMARYSDHFLIHFKRKA